MQQRSIITVFIILSVMLIGCSKKHIPETAERPVEKPVEKKPLVIKTKPTPIPKVITVNDAIAKRAPDGRLFYDLQGRRYWRNYDDGKYYLFNKMMSGNKSFIPH